MQDYRENPGMCGVDNQRDQGFFFIWKIVKFVSSVIVADSDEIELAM